MEKILNVIGNTATGCGTCTPKGCGSCGPAPRKDETPAALSRREFGHAVLAASASALLTGCSSQKNTGAVDGSAPAAPATPTPPALSPDLAVVKTSKGPIMTALDEFYKIGPGPSSSHTMGPMRITYDFFQRVSKLPEDQLQRATALKVHLFGSLSATGKGHGTDRASLAGLLGKAPATCPPAVSGRAGRQSRPDLQSYTRPQDPRPDPERHRLRRHQRRLPPSEHNDREAARRQRVALRVGILLSWRRIHRVERLQAT